MSASPRIRVGFFGKLPSRGDFVRDGLAREVADAWDAWLQEVIPPAQSALGDGWAAAWEAAPAWRFVLGAGVCGPQPMTGLFLPSMDTVGRLFPLLVAAEPAGMSPVFLDAAETIATESIRQAASPAALALRLRAAPPASPPAGAGPSRSRWWVQESGPGRPVLHGDTLPDVELFLRMLAP